MRKPQDQRPTPGEGRMNTLPLQEHGKPFGQDGRKPRNKERRQANKLQPLHVRKLRPRNANARRHGHGLSSRSANACGPRNARLRRNAGNVEWRAGSALRRP